MAEAIDERIVAAKFDATDFEKGVDKTIKKLDELKKSLDVKNTTVSVDELAKKSNTSILSIDQNIGKLTERLTSFTGMIKQKILGALADEVSGLFIRLQQSVTGFIKSISSDQIAVGMQKYEQMLTSVRVMMSAGESEDTAYEYIGQLRDYSDQTSYSLSQMTDALSKMRAAGVDIEVATKSVEGIANACANAGINATDAQRAFFNLSQAYSSGVLKYTDYRSLELLNMTTADFNKQILEAAVAAGTLEKTSNGVYKTINKNNKKVTAGKKVTEKNLQDMLRYNFVTSDVMNELFGGKFFFDEGKFREYKRKYDSLDEAIAAAKKDYGETAVNAYLAAREARSFTDVVNTLKDVVSTGWSTTFEYIFGRLEKAKEFFTQLVEGELADVVYKIGEYRNAILGYWSAMDEGDGSGGGEVFRQTIINITEALGTLLKTFLQVLPGFNELDYEEGTTQTTLVKLGDQLFIFTMHLRDMSKRILDAAGAFNTFMNTPLMGNEGPTRLDLIRSTMSKLLSVFGIVGKVIVIAFNGIHKVFYSLSPVFDGISIFLNKLAQPLADLNNNDNAFKKLESLIGNIATLLVPVADAVGKIVAFLGDVAAFIVDMSIGGVVANITAFSDALDLLVELFTGNSAQKLNEGESTLDRIKKDFEGIKSAVRDGSQAIGDFFTALIADLKKLFGMTSGDEAEQGQNGGIFSGVANFFKTNQFVEDAKAWVEQAITDVSGFIQSIPDRLKRFGANIYQTLRSLFFEEQTRYNGSQLETKTVLTPLGQWLERAIKDIKTFVISIPDRIIAAVGKVGNWIDEIFKTWFGNDAAKEAAKDGIEEDSKVEEKIMTEFELFIQKTVNSIKQWFKDLPNKITAAFKSVGSFVTRLWNTLDEFLFGKKFGASKTVLGKDEKTQTKAFTYRYKQGFSKWLDGVIKEIKKFLVKIPEYIKSGIKGAGDLISTVINALFGSKDTVEEVDSRTIAERLADPFVNIDLSWVLQSIADIGTTLINQIARIFTGTDDIEANQQWFAEKIAEGITWISEKLNIAFNFVLDFLKDLPTKIANLFRQEGKDNQSTSSPMGRAILSLGETVGNFILGLPNTILQFVTSAIKEIGKLWDDVYNALIGQAQTSEDAAAEAVPKTADPNTKTKWDEFVESLGKLISTAFEELPEFVAKGIHLAVDKVNELVGNIVKWIQGENIAYEMQQAAEVAKEQAVKGAEKVGEDVGGETTKNTAKALENSEDQGESDLLKAVKGIGQSLYNLITITIPAFVSEAWKAITLRGGEIWNSITGLFSGFKKEDFDKTVSDLGTNIKNAIMSLPDVVVNAFNTVSQLISNLFQTGDPMEDGLKNGMEDLNGRDSSRVYAEQMKKKAANPLVSAFKDLVESLFGDKGLFAQFSGEKILEFFTVTVPKFLGTAIGEVVNKIPTILDSLVAGLKSADTEKVEDDAEKAAERTEAVSATISDAFTRILDGFARSMENGTLLPTATTIVGLIAAIKGLEAIKELINSFNVMGNWAEKADSSNSFNAVMKRIATALMVTFGIVAYISSLPDDQRKEAKEVLMSLIDLFKLMTSLGGAASMVKDVTGTVSDVADAVKTIKGGGDDDDSDDAAHGFWGKAAEGAGSALGAMAKTYGITAAVEGAQYGIEDIINSVLNVFSSIGDALTYIAGYISEAVAAYKQIKDDIKVAIEVAKDAYTLVAETAKIKTFGESIRDIEAFMPTLSGALSLFKNSVSGRWVHAKETVESLQTLIGMIEPMRTFAAFAQEEAFTQFKYALGSLGAALSMYSFEGMESLGTSGGIKRAVQILSEILGDEKLAGLAQQLDTTKFPDAYSMFGASEKLVILAGAIASIAKASAEIESDAGDNLKNLFDAVSKIELPSDDKKVSELSMQFGTLGNALSSFANDTTGLTEEKMKSVKLAIDMMVDLTQSLKGTGQSFIEKVFEGDQGIDEFGRKVSQFGQKLAGFFESVGGNKTDVYNAQNIEIALGALRTLAIAYSDMNDNENLFKLDWNNLGTGLGEFGESFKTFIDEIKLIEVSEEQIKKLSGLLDIVNVLADVSIKGTTHRNNANQELGEMANQLDPTNEKGIGKAMIGFYNSITSLTINDNAIAIFKSFSETINALAEIAAEGLSTRNQRGIAFADTIFDAITTSFRKFNTEFDEIKNFFVNVKELDQGGIEIAKDVFSGLKDLSILISNFANNNVDKGLANLKWFDWEDLTTAISTKLSSNFDEHKATFVSIGQAIAPPIFEGIQAAFDNPELGLNPKITPVLELETAKQQLIDFFGTGTVDGFNLSEIAKNAFASQPEEERIKWTDLKTEIDTIAEAIKAGPTNAVTLEDVTSAFAKMKVVTNTGVLAGELTPDIDRLIGARIWLIQKGVAVQ